ncbi:MAG: ATP-binding cassette domain-containing protein [Anaerolineales bacterium]
MNLPITRGRHTGSRLELPSYLEQTPQVRDRFARLKKRPVILEVKGLHKEFNGKRGKVTALKDINFQTHKREFVCVIGPSGCGKSTLIRILAGLEDHSSGEVLLDGKPIQGPGPDRGMVFQSYTLFPWLTVRKNVMFGLEVSGRGGIAEQDAMQWIDLVGLSKFANSFPTNPAHGRTLRRPGRPNPRQDASVSAGNLAQHRHYRSIHHPRSR